MYYNIGRKKNARIAFFNCNEWPITVSRTTAGSSPGVCIIRHNRRATQQRPEVRVCFCPAARTLAYIPSVSAAAAHLTPSPRASCVLRREPLLVTLGCSDSKEPQRRQQQKRKEKKNVAATQASATQCKLNPLPFARRLRRRRRRPEIRLKDCGGKGRPLRANRLSNPVLTRTVYRPNMTWPNELIRSICTGHCCTDT